VDGSDCVFTMQLVMELLSPKAQSKTVHAFHGHFNMGFRGGLTRSEFRTALERNPTIHMLLKPASAGSETFSPPPSPQRGGVSTSVTSPVADLNFGTQRSSENSSGINSGRKRGGSLHAGSTDTDQPQGEHGRDSPKPAPLHTCVPGGGRGV
jgi:hypothetical protein